MPIQPHRGIYYYAVGLAPQDSGLTISIPEWLLRTSDGDLLIPADTLTLAADPTYDTRFTLYIEPSGQLVGVLDVQDGQPKQAPAIAPFSWGTLAVLSATIPAGGNAVEGLVTIEVVNG